MKAIFIVFAALCFLETVQAQDIYQPPGLDTINAGLTIPVRNTEAIQTEKSDGRVFSGIVDEDVMAPNGNLLIPKGSYAELIVKNIHGTLALDLDAVSIRGHRYAFPAEERGIMLATVQADAAAGPNNRISMRGGMISVPANSLLIFRLQEPLKQGVGDPGYMRDGVHYHTGYGEENAPPRTKPSGE